MSKQTLKISNNNFSLSKIKQLLLHQQKKVESEIKDLEKSDPVLETALAESSEPGTDSWLADVHVRAIAAKQTLQGMLLRTKKALTALKHGKYGKCEKCNKVIEPARLAAMSTATLCISCSKKSSKKS